MNLDLRLYNVLTFEIILLSLLHVGELPAADSWKSARKQIIFGFLGVLSLLSGLYIDF